MDKIYYIYITINLVNNKKYIGKHYGAIDDDYLGSGTLLKRAINKWRLNINLSFNIDPLKCPICDTIMIYTQSVWWGDI